MYRPRVIYFPSRSKTVVGQQIEIVVIFFYFGNDIVPAFNYLEVEKVWKSSSFFSQSLKNVFCFGRFYASRFDFLSTEYHLNSKRHFRRTFVYCFFLIIVFRYLLLHIVICLLSFTLPLFCKVLSTGEHTQILEVPSKVFFGNDIFPALYFVEVFSESFQGLFVLGRFTLRALTSSLCTLF